ncbi:hypothetical protein KAH55_05485, partial [bacterium]|nr:hypothetical protein [bacterium]
MRKSFTKYWLILGLVFISAVSGWSDPAIMGLDEIQPGMKAVGKTVFQGHKIEVFDLEIIDINYNFAPNQDLILVRLTSPN